MCPSLPHVTYMLPHVPQVIHVTPILRLQRRGALPTPFGTWCSRHLLQVTYSFLNNLIYEFS